MLMRFFIHLYGLISVIWPVPLRVVWPGVVLLGAWVVLAPFDAVLSRYGLSAFVLSQVIVLSALMWGNLPAALARLGKRESSAYATKMMTYILGFHVGLIGLLLWLNEPLLCQRVLTGGLFLRGILMVIGLAGNRAVMDNVAPKDEAEWCDSQRRHYVMVKVMVCLGLMAVNEALIAQGSLSIWVTFAAFLWIVMHALECMLLYLTYPFGPPDRQ